MDRADKLHDYTSTVFQACITDLLHESLQGRSGAERIIVAALKNGWIVNLLIVAA